MGFEETEVVGKRDMRGANLLAMVLRHGQHGGHLRVLENSGTSTSAQKR
jgi:hypothetical protein